MGDGDFAQGWTPISIPLVFKLSGLNAFKGRPEALLFPDVNVLVNAHREDAPQHDACLGWLRRALTRGPGLALCDQVLLGFLRVVTHPRIYRPATSPETAFEFCDRLRDNPFATVVSPGPRHWTLLKQLTQSAGARGDLFPDAYLAALALESGSQLVSLDEDFDEFPGLKWQRPH